MGKIPEKEKWEIRLGFVRWLMLMNEDLVVRVKLSNDWDWMTTIASYRLRELPPSTRLEPADFHETKVDVENCWALQLVFILFTGLLMTESVASDPVGNPQPNVSSDSQRSSLHSTG